MNRTIVLRDDDWPCPACDGVRSREVLRQRQSRTARDPECVEVECALCHGRGKLSLSDVLASDADDLLEADVTVKVLLNMVFSARLGDDSRRTA